MPGTNNMLKALAIALAGFLATAGFSQDLSDGWTPIIDERLLNPEPGDWMNYRRSYDATAFSPLDDINRRNVDDLRVAWAYSMRDGSRWLATPIKVVNL